MGVFTAFAASEGGTREVTWYPGAVFLVVLLAVVLVARGQRRPGLPVALRLALGFLGAFTVWSFASIIWADDPGMAWEAANLTLLYLVVFAVCAVWPWSPRVALLVLGAFGVAIATVGTVVLAKAAGSADAASYLIKQRFAEPVGYPNGNAALFVGAAWVLVLPASRRETPWLVRGLTLGAAGVLVELALLSQSRGSALATVVTAVLFLAVVPGRVRSLLAIAAIAAMAVLSSPDLFEVYDVAQADGDVAQAMSAALDAVVLTLVVLVGLGASVGLVERHAGLPRSVLVAGGRAIGALAVLGGIAGLVAVLAATGNPVTYAQDRWDEFTSGDPLTEQFEGTRLTAGVEGRSRDDFWRIALDDLADRPWGGMGAGNFAIVYVRDRRSADEPLHPHSFPVRVLTQTGVVGAVLFLGFLLSTAAAVWRVRRFPDPLRRAVAGGAAIGFAYWFVHAGGDWLYAIPAVAGPAFAWWGMAAALGVGPQSRVRLAAEAEAGEPPPVAPGPWRQRAAAAAVVVATVAALATLVPPWLAATAVDEAATAWRHDPAEAFDLLDRARGLNGLSDRPDLVAGVIASRLGQRARAREAFAHAVERNPLGWYGHQQLGIEEALAGRRGVALRELERARELNPLEETTRLVLNQVRRRRRPSPVEVRNVLLDRVCSRVPSAQVC